MVKNYIKALERILVLDDKIKAIEKKQAERFPMLVGKLDKLEDDISKLTKTVYNIKRWTS